MNEVGITSDGKALFDGKLLFNLKATHGMPLDFSLGAIFDSGMAVNWTEFIDEARKNKWKDSQIYKNICYAMLDAMLPREVQEGIKTRLNGVLNDY